MIAQQHDFAGLAKAASALSATAMELAGTADELFHYTSVPIKSEEEVLERAEVMDYLMDMARQDNDIMLVFANAIADRIEEFEQDMVIPAVSVAERLRMLMAAKAVKQKDLTHIAPQSVISEILNGKRLINLNHAKGFAQFFKLPLEYFVE
jgi:HTH-type transcriptional regulator / antitoxin HigA